MTTHHHFLAAILCNLGSPTPILIYADWLEEQGDADAEWWRGLGEGMGMTLIGWRYDFWQPKLIDFNSTEWGRSATLPMSRLAQGVRERLEEQAAFSEALQSEVVGLMQEPLQEICDQLCEEAGLPNVRAELAQPDTRAP